MTRCYVALGSNLHAPQRQLRLAVKALQALPQTEVIKVADFYKNKAWGRQTQPDFYNTVVAIETRLSPLSLLTACQSIERKHKRSRRLCWGARTLDVDIILYGSLSLKTPTLTLPHPRYLERDFVLKPLMSILNKPI